jgi:uncharacterized membrane protein
MSEVIAERRKIWLAIVFVLMVALLLALRAPWTSSLWLDETLSAWTVNGTFSDAWNRSLAFQTQSPLFYLVLWSFIHYLGDGEIMLRSVSILSAVGSVVAVFSIAKKLSGNWEVPLLSCGFLLSCDVFQIGALTARPYALATLTALCSVACLIELLREWRARIALLFVSSVVLTVYTHYLFGIVVHAHGVVLMRHRQVLRRLWA